MPAPRASAALPLSPQVVQEADAWQYDFRQYHGAWVKHQKTNGIYVNAPTVVSA